MKDKRRKRRSKRESELSRMRFVRMIPTPDDFHPSYPGGMVQVKVLAGGCIPRYYVAMVVSGADDCGFSRFWNFGSRDDALSCFFEQVLFVANWGGDRDWETL